METARSMACSLASFLIERVAEHGRAALQPDLVDARQPVQEPPQRRLVAHRVRQRRGDGGGHGPESRSEMHMSGVSAAAEPRSRASRDAVSLVPGTPGPPRSGSHREEHPMSTTRTTVRNGGRWLLAAAVVFVAGFALALFVEPGGWMTELGVALPLVAGAVLLVIGTATAASASPSRPLAVGAVIAAVGCALGVTGLVTASMLAELGGLDVEGLYIPLATVTSALGGAAVAALAVALRGSRAAPGLCGGARGRRGARLPVPRPDRAVRAGRRAGCRLGPVGCFGNDVTMSRRQLAFAAGLVPVLVWAAVGTPAFVAELSTPCPTGICATFERPTPEAVGFYAALGISPFGYALAVTVLAWAQLLLAAAVALLLPRSRSGGLLVAVTAVLLPVVSATGFGAALATRSAVGQVLDVAAGVVVGVLTPLLFGLFPDGRWHPRWFRWAWLAPAAVSTVSLAGPPELGDSAAVAVAELASWLLLVGIQVHRYRRADWTARQQTKLVLLAVVLVITNLVLGTLADLAGLIGAYQPIAVLLTTRRSAR